MFFHNTITYYLTCWSQTGRRCHNFLGYHQLGYFFLPSFLVFLTSRIAYFLPNFLAYRPVGFSMEFRSGFCFFFA